MEVAAVAQCAFSSKAHLRAWGPATARDAENSGRQRLFFVKRVQFVLTEGEEHIETVFPQPPYKYVRSFCRNCGTSLGEPLSPDALFPINAQCLDDDPLVQNTFFEFVSDLPIWLDLVAAGRETAGNKQSSGASQT